MGNINKSDTLKKGETFTTNLYDLEWALYEMLNNLDYALDNEEIKSAQADFFKSNKLKFNV